jgi:hypothetical protein
MKDSRFLKPFHCAKGNGIDRTDKRGIIKQAIQADRANQRKMTVLREV